MKKHGIFVILILILVVCISNVNAENIGLDDNLTINSTVDSVLVDNVSHSHSQVSRIISDTPVKLATINAPGGSLSDLQAIISSASTGDTISLSGNYAYNSGTDSGIKNTGISINNMDLTFNGNGYTISGNGESGFLAPVNSDITFNNIRLVNFYKGANGGAIYASNSNIVIKNSILSNMNSTNQGGFLYGSGDFSLTIIGSTLSNMYAGDRGGIAYMTNNGVINLINSTFTNLRANGHDAGGVYRCGNGAINIIGSNFDDVCSIMSGPFIYSEGSGSCDINISKSSFNNVYSTSSGGFNGGVISTFGYGFIEITYSSFKDINFLGNAGGGIVFSSNNDEVYISNSNFTNVYSDGNGGIIRINNGNITILDSNFKNAHTNNLGGIAYQDGYGNITIKNSNFENINSNSDGGAFYRYNDGDLTILDSKFKNISSYYSGGLLYSRGGGFSNIIINKSTFDNTYTTRSGGYNGGILSMGGYGNCDINNSNFTSINFLGTNGGGVIWTSSHYELTIFNSIFKDIYSAQDGGVACIRSYGNLTIFNSSFNNISSSRDGGIARINDAGNTTILYSNFTNIQSGSEGGIICRINGNDYFFSDSIFINVSASGYGGIIYNGYVSNIVLINTTFNTITSGRHGGIAFITNKGNLTILDSVFDTVSAHDGGIVRYDSDGNTIIINSNFTNTRSSSEGSVVCRITKGDYLIINSNFKDFYANGHGGIVYSGSDADFIVINSSFIDGYANRGGVAFISGAGEINFTNSVFINMSTGDDASVIRLDGAGDTTVINCTFLNDFATRYGYGGVFYHQSTGDLNLINSTFKNILSGGEGGLARIGGNGIVNIFNSNFTNVTGGTGGDTVNGGLIHVINGADFNINNSNFKDIYSNGYGGVIYIAKDGNGNITNSTFKNTTSVNDGSVVYIDGGGNVHIFNSSFNTTHAHDGGVVRVDNFGDIKVFDSNFYNINGSVDGGVFCLISSGDLVIFNSNFTNIFAGSRGGLFYGGSNNNVNITNSHFLNVSSVGDGGVLYVLGSADLIITNSSFVNLSAGSYSFIYYPNAHTNATVNDNIIVVNNLSQTAVYSNGDFNKNWWGINVPDFYTLFSNNNYPETWVVMGFTNTTPINSGYSPTTLLVSLNTLYNSTSQSFTTLTYDLPKERTAIYNTTIPSGSFSNNNIDFIDDVTNTISYSSIPNNWLITATVDHQLLPLGPGSLNINITVSTNPVHLYELVNYTITVDTVSNFNNLSIFFNSSFIYVSSSGYGSYNETTRIWFVDNVNSTSPRNITITVRVPYNESLVNTNVTTQVNTTAYIDLNPLYEIKCMDEVNVTVLNITGGSYTLLQMLIDNTPENGTLIVPFNVTYDPVMDAWLSNGMIINKSINLIGNGMIIDGIGEKRMFVINSPNVNITNLTFINGVANRMYDQRNYYNYYGGAIFSNNDNLTIYGCSFINCNSSYVGGALFYSGTNIIVNNSIFINNYAQSSAAIHQWSWDPSIITYITNSTFIDNKGDRVLRMDGTAYITDSLFENNTPEYVIFSEYGSINNNAFINNSGRVYQVNGDIESNWWGTNTPNWNNLVRGSAPETWIVMDFKTNTPLQISGGTINLTATLNKIYNQTSENFTNLTEKIPIREIKFETNLGTLSLTTSQISNQSTSTILTYPTGIVISDGYYVNATIDNQTLYLPLVDLDLKITNVTKSLEPQIGDRVTFTLNITNNGPYNITYAPGYEAIYVNFTIPSPLNYLYSIGEGNYTTDGIWIISNLTIGQSKTINITTKLPFNYSLIGQTVPINTSIIGGNFLRIGEIYDNTTLNITNKTSGSYTDLQDFIDNTPENGTLIIPFNVTYDPIGDAWLQEGMRLNKSINLIGNDLTISGLDQARIFHITSPNVNITRIIFTNGQATRMQDTHGSWNYYGGAIFSNYDNLTIYNCTFTNCHSNSVAGAIFFSADNLNISFCNFINNTATGSSVLHQWLWDSWRVIYITNSTFINNTGDRMIRTDAISYITNNLMENNTASDILIESEYGNITNNAFVNNNGRIISMRDGNTNNNWWGTNNPNISYLVRSSTPETYVIMNFTNITPITYTTGLSTLLVTLDTIYNTTSNNYTQLTGEIPIRQVIFNWTIGNVNPNTTSIQKNTTSTFSYPSNMQSFLINATIDNQTLFIGSCDLEVIIIPSNNPANDGDNISFTVIVINNGYVNASNVNITLTIPYGLINVTGTTNNGTFNNTTFIWTLGDINASSNKTLILNGTINNPGKFLLLNASLNDNEIYDGNLTNNNYTCNVTIIQWSDLEIKKNISNPTPQTRENITYTITVFNHGPSTAINVTVFDNLSTKLIYQTSNATNGYYNETTGIWFIDNITPGNNETLNITVLINESGFTNNFVNVSCAHNDTNWTNNYDNISFETPPLSDLWVTINMEPQTSNYITFHIQAGNNGIEPANGTVVVFNLSNLYFYYNHTEDKGLYNNLTGVWDIGYLDVDETVNMTLIVRLDFPTGISFANVTTSVNITSWSTDLYPENNTDNITFEAELFGNFRLLQDYVDSWAENTTQILPRSFAYDPILDAKWPSETYDLINGVRLYKNVTIVNPYGYTIGGYDMARIFNISADNIILDSLKIVDGNSPLGAGLNIHADNVQVLRSIFTCNWLFGDYGGAIYTQGANTLIMDNIFYNNSASKLGGAIGALGATNLRILNNTFINNTVESDSVFGGAVGIENSTNVIVNGNVFLDNMATNAPNLGSAIYTYNSDVNIEANWFGNNTPDMSSEHLIYGVKPETYIILDWEIINPNMTGVQLNVVFLLYNRTSGNKTPLGYGVPYRNLSMSARNPTLSTYNSTYTGNNSAYYTYNVAIPVYEVNATVDYQTITLEWSTFLDTYKALVNDTIWFGDDLIYIINLTNYGPHNSYVVNIADLLPENLIINNVTPTSGSTSIMGDNVYWSIVITAGTNETLIVNTTPQHEGIYINNLTVNSTSPYDYFLHGNTSVTGEVLPLIDLSINFTISNPPYYVGEEINYTITIHNNGPSNATNVSVYIPIPTGLTYLYAWNLDGYMPVYNSGTGLWDVGNLTVGETIQINMTLRLDSRGWYNQTVNITGYGVELNQSDNNKTISFNVTTQVDLELNMTISTNETFYGNVISITYSLLNKGPSPATNTNVFTNFNGLTYYYASGYGGFNNITPFTGYWNIGTLNKDSIVSITVYFYTNTLGNFTVTGRANCSDNESYWPDNYANVSLSVIKYADLSITKTVNNTTPFLEDTITYTITVTNNHGFDATNVIVYDPLPSVLLYDNSNPSFNGTHWIVGNLSVDETKTLTFNVTIDGIGIIWNNATVNSSLNDSNPNNNHAEVSIDVPVADDLRIYLNVIPSTPSSNNDFLINISVWNRGFTDNQNVTVEFHIPAGLIYINSTQMGAYNLTSGIWDIGFLANGAWTNLEIWVRPNTIGNITIEANVSGFVADVAPWNNRANLTFEIVPSFDLTVTKTANTTNINDGEFIGFDISVWNNGPYTANNVQVTDYLPSGLLYYSNNASGVYDSSTHTVNWTIPTLNVGDNLTFHLILRAWNPGLSFTNTVTASAYGTDSNITDNTATVTVNVTQINDLEVRINASKTNDIDLGETIIFYITVLNHGPSNATNVIANFQIPSIFTYISDTGSGYYIPSTGDWYIGNIGSGTNITLAVTVNLTTLGLTKANATVNSTYLDKNLSNNYDELNLTATPVFDLNITAYWNLTNNTLIWGEIANLTIVVYNKGPENATNVTVEINVPGVSYISDNGLGSFNSTTMVWSVGNLSVGETKTLTITFKGETCGFYWTTGNITGHGHDNDTSDNNYTLNLTIIPVVDLVMTNLTVNTTFAGVDEILEFNVTVYNKGPCNATNTTIVGLLPSGWYIYSGSVVADIPVNTSHTFNIYVNASTYGNFTVGFNATINGVDTYPLDNHKYIGPIEIIYHADIMISIKVNNDHPATGDIIVYVITVSNLDWRTAHNVTANITIPSNLTLDHYYLSSGSYNPLNGSWTIGDMSFRNSTSLFLFARVNTPGRTSFWVNVTGDDYDFHPENNNDTVDIIASLGLDLNITITVDNSTPYTGDNVTFTVVVENIGLVDATDVSVDINIPTGFINPHSTDLNFTGASWFVGNLSSGTSKTLNFTVIPISTNNLTVNVSVNSNKFDSNMGNNFANVSVSPQGASDLQVTITSNNSNPLVGENVTYTITVKNNGLIDVNNVFVYNTLPYSLTYSTSTLSYDPTTKIWSIGNLPSGKSETLNITINHTTIGIFNYTVNITGNTIDTNTSNNQDNITTNVIQDNDLRVEFKVSNLSVIDEALLEFNITIINDGIFNDTNVKVYTDLPTTSLYNSTGLFDTNQGIWNIGNLSAGENKTLTLLINMTGVGNYTYWANVTGTQKDRNITNNNQSLNVSVYADFDLIVNIIAINTTVNINDTLTFQVTVTNNGQSTAYNVQVLDNIYGTVQAISKGTYTSNTWNISSLKSGESETLNITIKPNTNGTYTFNVNVSSDNINYDNNLTNNKDNITINVTSLVDLIITVTTNTTLVESGEIVEYTINILNNGSITATNILMEALNLFNNVISINPSTGLVSSNSWLIFSLAPNTAETLKITRYIYNDTVSFVNVTSDNPDCDNSTNTANTTVNIIKKTDLMINITANSTNLFVEENITFTITVTNLGNNTANNVTVKLDLPYAVNYDNVYMYDSLQGVWLIGDLENNTSISFNITASIYNEGIIIFNASVNSTTPDIYLVNNRDNVTLNVSSLVDLSISLELNTTDTIYSGDNFTIFVNVSNFGPSNATNVNVTVNIPGTYTTFNGTYTSGIWNIGNLNTGKTVYLNITCNLTSLNNGIYKVNTTSKETDKNLTNNLASINLTIIDISDLGVNITSSVSETDILGTVIYTVTVTNYGPNNVNDAIVELNIPSSFNITSNMSSSGIFNGTHWKLNSLGTGFGGIANLYIFGHYTTYGNQTISVSVNSSNKDFNNTNNLSNVSVWVTPVTNLTVNFTTTGYYNLDGTITFNITVTNNGPCNATDIKIYTNLNPTDDYNETIGYFDTLQDIWYINELQVGETETLIINTTYIGGIRVYANATSGTNELDNIDNFKTLNFTLTPLADLSINITSNNSNPIYGESVEFTITVTNLGVYNATNVIVYTDLPSTPTYTVSKGLFSTVSGNWGIGNLTVGETVTLKIILNITNDLNTHVNVTGNVNDTNNSNNKDTINISLKHVADLSINLTVNQSSFTVGDNITFTISVTNYGPNTAENLTINISLPVGFIPDTNYNWTLTSLTNDSSITYNVTGILTTPGIKYVNTTVTSDTHDNNTNNNINSLIFNVEDTVDLIITISSNTTNILAGEYINLLVNVTNLGNGTAHNILVQTNIINGTGDKTGYYDKDTGYWYIGNLTNNTSVILNLTIKVLENITYIVSVNTSNTDTNSSNNNDTLNINVTPRVDLDINVIVNSKTLYIDDEIIYTIFVTNYGPSLAENVIVNLTDNTLNFTYSNNTSFNNLTGVWSIGNLSSGETVILILKYTANNTGNITTLFNLTTSTNETNITNNMFNMTVEVLNSTKPLTNLVDLIINITVDNPTPSINSTVTFNVTVYNNMSTTANNLTIRSFVPSGLTPLGVFDWNITNLGAYSNISFTFQANISNYGSYVVNTSVDCNEWDKDSTNNRANVLIVCNAPSGDYTDLTINITRTGNLTIDELVTYIVNVTNNGPSLANDVNVTIGFTDGLEYVSDNGSNSYNYTDSLWTIGNLNPGETKTLEIVLNITKQGYYTSVFLVYSGSMDSKPENNLVLDKFEVNDTRVDINIRITANRTYASENESINFTVTVINPSLNTAHDVNVTLTIPSEFIILNMSGNDTDSSYYIGNLTSGAQYNFTFTAKLNSTNSSTIIVNATLNDTDSYTGDNTDSITITPLNGNLNGVADLMINITVNEQYPEILTVPIFNIWVTNKGPDDATNITIPVFVPENCVSTSVLTPTGSSWDNSTSTFHITNLSVGSTMMLEVSFRINNTEPLLFNVTASCDQFDPNITDNTASISLYPWEATPTCDLNVTIVPIGNEFYANGTVTLNITIRNFGNKTAYNVSVRNIVPDGLTIESIKTTWAYTNTSYGWFMSNHPINTNKSFLVTYKIANPGLYHTTVNVNSSTFDVDPTNNGMGVAIYAGEPEPDRRNVTTKVTPTVATATLSLSADTIWNFKGTLKMANTTTSPTQAFSGQKLYANITKGTFSLTVESVDLTSNTGVANFQVAASQLDGTGNYKVVIYYAGEKTDDTYYLPFTATQQTKRVTINT